ncbi:hypothetical protein MKX07_008338 [Trichoderma sp. CBMAI-0711]|nr:hypothetical protein MKX07_008338 [Trichoderma sp. CBMAI-0711]
MVSPYAPAVLRFQILFPDAYPRAPPLVTFSTDIFHPLITPLTTHMYPTSGENDGSTTERPKLPPGGFSLEHGFPEWFGGSRRRAGGSRQSSRERRGASPSAASTTLAPSTSDKSPAVPPKDVPPKEVPPYMQTDRKTISTYSLLKYIRSTFDKAEVLDAVPLSAAGNPGAWHAWRTHRRKEGKVFEEKKGHRLSRLSRLSIIDGLPKFPSSEQGDAAASDAKSIASQSTTREPGDWNWDGVWEDRVKKGVASTLTESVLYGASGISDDMVRCFGSASLSPMYIAALTLRFLTDSFPGPGRGNYRGGQGQSSPNTGCLGLIRSSICASLPILAPLPCFFQRLPSTKLVLRTLWRPSYIPAFISRTIVPTEKGWPSRRH